MEASKGKVFDYPWYHLWRSMPFAAALTGFAAISMLLAITGTQRSDAWAGYALVVMFCPAAIYYLCMYLLMLWEPQEFAVDRLGVTGVPQVSRSLRLDWSEVRSVSFPRRSIFSTGEVMLIGGPRRKRMRVCSDLRGYKELKEIVLEQAKERDIPVTFPQTSRAR